MCPLLLSRKYLCPCLQYLHQDREHCHPPRTFSPAFYPAPGAAVVLSSVTKRSFAWSGMWGTASVPLCLGCFC